MQRDRRRRVLRFFGPRGDLLAVEMPSVAVFDASGNEKFRVEIEGFLDVAPVGDELWVVFADRLERISATDGRTRGTERIDYLDPNGRILQSSTAPQIPIWHAARPSALRNVTPPIPADVILPIAEGRWLLWQAGQLRMWRNIGEAWRKPFGEPSTRVADAELVLEGRLFVLAQQRLGANGEPTGELQENTAKFLAYRATNFDLAGVLSDEAATWGFARVAQLSGVTTATDLHNPLPGSTVDGYVRASLSDDFPIRLLPAFAGASVPTGQAIPRLRELMKKNNDKLRFQLVKLVTDGSIQGLSARMRWPGYYDGTPNGVWNVGPDELDRMVLDYHRAGFQVHIHTNGEAGFVNFDGPALAAVAAGSGTGKAPNIVRDLKDFSGTLPNLAAVSIEGLK